MVDIGPSIAAALIRPVVSEGQPPLPACPATIVDVADRAVGLRVGPDVDVTPDRLIEVAIHGRWSRGRVIWSRAGIRDAVIASVELAETRPDISWPLPGIDEPAAVLAS
jgi:hypothetical protein